jgi:hypothetical protein
MYSVFYVDDKEEEHQVREDAVRPDSEAGESYGSDEESNEGSGDSDEDEGSDESGSD